MQTLELRDGGILLYDDALVGAYWGESGISELLRSGLARMDMIEKALAEIVGV